MSKTEYKEDWKLHNFGNEQEIKREASLPNDFDKTLFDDEQIEYLCEFLADYRTETMKIMLDFITNLEANGSSKKNKDALFVRIAARAVIIDSVLNARDYKVLDLKTTYGISTHQYYDEIGRLTNELQKQNKNINELLKRR